MKLHDLERWLRAELEALDHDEITEVTSKARGEILSQVTQGARLHNGTIQEIRYASGAATHLQVIQVRGPGIPSHPDYTIPKEAW